jgi:hypothetical protein
VRQTGDDCHSDIGRLCQEMLRVLAHSQIRRLHAEAAEQVDLGDLALLARALKDFETAVSINAVREIKLREAINAKLDNHTEQARTRAIDPALLERAKLLVRGPLTVSSDERSTISNKSG